MQTEPKIIVVAGANGQRGAISFNAPVPALQNNLYSGIDWTGPETTIAKAFAAQGKTS
jgi:hypothetical protein